MVNITGSSSGDIVPVNTMKDPSSDTEKIAIIDDILSALDLCNERIEENQKAINISKIQTRVMLDQLKELTKNA